MGLFDFLKKDKKDEKISLNKKIDLRKETVAISLKKKNVESLISEVVLCMDSSGSMYNRYHDGKVQDVLERIIPLSLKFDDDGQVPVYTFANNCNEHITMSLDNLENYTEENLIHHVGGGTYYSNPINMIIEKAQKNEFKYPVFVIFITDGENSDHEETERALRTASNYDIYFQFVGIGNESFKFLRKLDNLSGRRFDNAGFFSMEDFDKVSDETLYDELLNEFIDIYKNKTFKNGVINLTK